VLDLSDIPLVDNHCHGLLADDRPMTVDDLRLRFQENGFDEPFPPEHVPTSVHYLWALRQMAEVLDCEATEESVVAARAALSQDEIERRYMDAAGIEWLLVDDGYPNPADTVDREEQARRTGCRVGWVERIETVAGRLVADAAGFQEWDEQLRVHLTSARDRGVCSLKSVAAYRSGLAIAEPEHGQTVAAFNRLRDAGGSRIAEKALVDHVVRLGMAAAETQELPVQFHTGYGDADADLLLADPLHLRGLLHEFPSVPVVMLHGAYPYTRKLGVLAATYPNAYVDVSYAIPFLNSRELLDVTREALACAPAARFMYSSDGVGLADHYWLGAVRGRQAIGAALEELVAAGDLDQKQALQLARLILNGNAKRIYHL